MNEPSKDTLNSYVYQILRQKRGWLTPYVICATLQLCRNTLVSDSSVTARLRDLRKSRYGGHSIVKRRKEGSRSFEYRLEGK